MDVIDQGGSIDLNKLIEYVAKDFPREFKQIVEARDELAKRQGAIGAAEAAIADRQQAAADLAAAHNQAQQIVIDADAKRREVDEQAADLKTKIAKFNADVKAQSAPLKRRLLSVNWPRTNLQRHTTKPSKLSLTLMPNAAK